MSLMLEFHRSLLIIIRITSPSNSQPFFEKKQVRTRKLLRKLVKRLPSRSRTSAPWRVWLKRRRWWRTMATSWRVRTLLPWRRPTSPPSLSPSLQESSSSHMLPPFGLELIWLNRMKWIIQECLSEWFLGKRWKVSRLSLLIVKFKKKILLFLLIFF